MHIVSCLSFSMARFPNELAETSDKTNAGICKDKIKAIDATLPNDDYILC